MADRTLRGSRMGTTSYEIDRNTDLAPRRCAAYLCLRGHTFTVPFADDADVPSTWECRLDGTTANLTGGEEPDARKARPQRTHWDMLLERRTVADLEEVLAERLEHLRDRRGSSRKSA